MAGTLPDGTRPDDLVPRDDVPARLRQLLDAGATDISCTDADLEDVFLDHYAGAETRSRTGASDR